MAVENLFEQRESQKMQQRGRRTQLPALWYHVYRMSLRMKVEDPALDAAEVIGGEIDHGVGYPTDEETETDNEQGDPAVAAHEEDTDQEDPEPDTEDEAEVLSTNDHRRRRNSGIGMICMGTRSKTKRNQGLVDFLPPPISCKRAARCLEDFNSDPFVGRS